LPEFDQLLAERLEQKGRTLPLDAQLVGRYSTRGILPRVKAVYGIAPGQWDCVAEDGFVSYFLRVEPNYGVEQLAAAASSCLTESIDSVIRMKRWREVEPRLVAKLNDPDLNRARNAAETLSRYGGPKAEKALWSVCATFTGSGQIAKTI